LHTFKGGFASFGLRQIEKKLHMAEDAVQELAVQSIGIEVLEDVTVFNAKEMCSWLDQEEENIKTELAHCIPCEKIKLFREDQFLRIYPEQIETVRKRLKDTVPKEYHDQLDHVLSNLEKIRIKELLNYYRYVVDNIAEKLGKTLYPLVIEGDDVYVDPKKFGKWADTLIHIFRNAIDHGIETSEERIMLDKPQYGRIRVNVMDEDSQFRVEISDDGRGIDIQEISKSALEKGFLDYDKTPVLDEESLLAFIFTDGFSTKDNVDLISGRGTGLSAVKNEWEKLGGTIAIYSEKDKGTVFVFTVQKPL